MRKSVLKRVPAMLLAGTVMLASFTSCAGKKTVVKNASSAMSGGAASSEAASQQSQSTAASAISIGQNAGGGGTAGENIKTGKSYSKPSYSTKSYFGSGANKKETKIGINNKNVVAPNIPSSAPNSSIIKRTTIEGVDGSFYDANIKESPRNLQGKTFTFMTCWTSEFTGGKNATKDSQRCAQAIKAIDNDYNCKLTVKTYPIGHDEVITEARAAGRVPANIFDTLGSGLPIFSNGNGADLTTVKTVNVKNNAWDPVETLVSSYKSKVFGVNVRYDRKEQDLLFFNKKLADTYNLGNFYDMVKKGQWTDDRFLQVCQAFKKYCGSKYIVSSAMYPAHLLNLVYTNWTSPFGITSNKYIFNGTDNSVLSILLYLQDFVKGGLFDTFTDDKSSASEYTHAVGEFVGGKSLFFFGSNGDAVLPYISSSSKDNYGLLPLPKGPSADDYSTVITNCRYFSLFNGDPNLEDSGALLTALANRTNIKTADIVANNATLTRDNDSINTLTQNYLHKQIINIELNSSGNLPDIYYKAALTCVLKGQSTPKQAMDSISRMAQTAIDTAYGQK